MAMTIFIFFFHGVSLLPFVALIWAGGSAQDHSVEHEALLT